MRIALASVLAAACSAPASVPARPPAATAAPRAPISAEPTCTDMGPLLRGEVDDEEGAGREKEAAISAACTRDGWPRAVLECVASATEPTAKDCLAQLPAVLVARYQATGEPFGGEVLGTQPDPQDISCADTLAATAIDGWPPAVTAESERSLATRLRDRRLRALCETWDAATKSCITSTPTSELEPCLAMMDAGRADVERALREADELRAKIVAAMAKPARVTCEKVAASHYAPAKWAGQAADVTGAVRTKLFARLRASMVTACKAWPVEARACMLIDDGEPCYALAGTTGSAWGLGGTATIPPTGIPECDDYAAAIFALASCPSLPESTRQMMLEAFGQAADAWKSLDPAGRADAAVGCKAAADATRDAAKACT